MSQYAAQDYVHVLKLDPKAKLPERANELDAGADLFSTQSIKLAPSESALIGTGIAIKLMPGTYARIENRSSQRVKGITSLGSGIIDAGYRGELKVYLLNLGTEVYEIIAGVTKIGQLLVLPVRLPTFVDVWNDSDRGAGGFGSTGK